MSSTSQFTPFFAPAQPFGAPLFDRNDPSTWYERHDADPRDPASRHRTEPHTAHPPHGRPETAATTRDGRHRGKGPKGYRRSDERILDDCCECLASEGWLDASEIQCRVDRGEVVLSGSVPDRRQKRLAEACCAEVTGVHDVHNRLRVATR